MEKSSTTMNLTAQVNNNRDVISHYRLSLVHLKIKIHQSVPEMQKEGDAGANHGKKMKASRSAQHA